VGVAKGTKCQRREVWVQEDTLEMDSATHGSQELSMEGFHRGEWSGRGLHQESALELGQVGIS
jgi:hypothetical protein